MTANLAQLVQNARKIEMSSHEIREQRRSFVYGNTYIENDRITREIVTEADHKLERQKAKNDL